MPLIFIIFGDKIYKYWNDKGMVSEMYVSHIDNVPKEKVEMENEEGEKTTGTWIQWLIREKQEAKNYAMRLFTMEPNAKIAKHYHPWEHEIFVLSGEGIIGVGDKEVKVHAGNFLYIEPDIPHWYRNESDKEFKFLCIIPIRK